MVHKHKNTPAAGLVIAVSSVMSWVNVQQNYHRAKLSYQIRKVENIMLLYKLLIKITALENCCLGPLVSSDVLEVK